MRGVLRKIIFLITVMCLVNIITPLMNASATDVGDDITFSYTSCRQSSSNSQYNGLYIYNVEFDNTDVINRAYITGVKIRIDSTTYRLNAKDSSCTGSTDSSSGRMEITNEFEWEHIGQTGTDLSVTVKFEAKDLGSYGTFKFYEEFSWENTITSVDVNHIVVFWKIDWDINNYNSNGAKKGNPWSTVSPEAKGTDSSWDRIRYQDSSSQYVYSDSITKSSNPSPDELKWGVFNYDFEDYYDHGDNDQNEDVTDEDIVGTWKMREDSPSEYGIYYSACRFRTYGY